jgi:GNAT superfamily N-acetyltransferase
MIIADTIRAISIDSGMPPEFVESHLVDDVYLLPGGAATVNKYGVIHIYITMRGRGLHGRLLVKAMRAAEQRLFETHRALYAPIHHGNHRAIRFVESFGFKPYTETETHVWLKKERSHVEH